MGQIMKPCRCVHAHIENIPAESSRKQFRVKIEAFGPRKAFAQKGHRDLKIAQPCLEAIDLLSLSNRKET